VDDGKNAVNGYKEAALAARAALRSSLGDLKDGPSETRPTGLVPAVAAVNSGLASTSLVVRVHDRDTGVAFSKLSVAFYASLNALEHWVKISESVVASAQSAVERLQAAEQRLAKVLGDMAPKDVTVAPPKDVPPPGVVIEEPTSYVDWAARTEQPDVVIERLAEGGARTSVPKGRK
jgi:hypothetical protein